MTITARTGRLSILAAAWVMARRDFTAILFSRSFFFFLLGPLFPVVVGALAGGISHSVGDASQPPQLGVALSAHDLAALRAGQARLAPQLGKGLPDLTVLRTLAPGEAFDAAAAIRAGNDTNLAAVLTGSLAAPVLTGPADRLESWQGRVALLTAEARRIAPTAYPAVTLRPVTTSTADQASGRRVTAQLGQTLLFLLTMLLAGMVLSNLVEEKGNKIIEVLAAAIPMEAVFLGKLFAMLAVSWVGIAVWALAGTAVWFAAGPGLADVPAPGVGWPAFLMLGVAYFSLGYLLLGSIFLAIGSMAATVREVQTLSMPVTMLQLVNFFFASFAIARPGSALELAAIAVPFSSPFAMLARGAQGPELWPHLVAIGWQALWVLVLVRAGAALFRQRVMKSGPARAAPRRHWRRWGRSSPRPY